MTNKVVSLDVFDTALVRSVYLPTDIFKLVEEKVGNDFHNKRIEAEEKARKKFGAFYTIDDIYTFLPWFSKKTELDTELANCMAEDRILALYKEDPRKYIFISDMYLSSEDIKKMLEKAGYENPRVFVSCEYKACKGDGELFKRVQEKGFTIEKHYGDNYVADIWGAHQAGIKDTVFNPALHKIKLNLPAVKNPVLKRFLAHIEYTCHPLRKIPLNLVPLVVGFTEWVIENKKKGRKIFFLSRDMYVPYMLAKWMREDVDYLYASRKSMAPACFKSSSKQLIEHLSPMYTKEEISNFKKADITEIKNYLMKKGVRNGDILVDIGYSGTIQAAINEALGIETIGLYMQTGEGLIPGLKTKMYLSRPAIQYYLMIETILGSDEDCVIGYKNGEPIFEPENNERKEMARIFNKELLEMSKMFVGLDICSVPDVEQVLIHHQYYPSKDVIELFNKHIYSNREFGESIVGFDRDKIMDGKLKELYDMSYCKPLFKQLLEEDKELSHLSSLLY